MAPELKIGTPEGSLIEISESGYIDSALFVKWLEFFIQTVHPTKDSKVLLSLDKHNTHSNNLRALELTRDHGVINHSWYCNLCKKNEELDMIQCQQCTKWVFAVMVNDNQNAVCGNVSLLRKFYFCPYCLRL